MSETAEWGNVCSRVDTCALTGAAAFFTGIKGAEVLVNGPLWCYFYALRHLEKSNSRLGERFHGSQPDNNAVVYGTEECLTDALDYIREICQYIKISSKQEEELVRLYKIEKLGHSTVKAWDEIQQIILDIYQLRKNEKVPGIFVLMK